jgi:mannitol-1-phosphate/altronate dehydrogenase
MRWAAGHISAASPTQFAVGGSKLVVQSFTHAVTGIDLGNYIRVLLKRFSNPTIRDTSKGMVTDSSNQMQAFVLPTLPDQLILFNRATIACAVVTCRAERTVADARIPYRGESIEV